MRAERGQGMVEYIAAMALIGVLVAGVLGPPDLFNAVGCTVRTSIDRVMTIDGSDATCGPRETKAEQARERPTGDADARRAAAERLDRLRDDLARIEEREGRGRGAAAARRDFARLAGGLRVSETEALEAAEVPDSQARIVLRAPRAERRAWSITVSGLPGRAGDVELEYPR